MSKKMLINATHPEENRVAIVEDGILTELDIEIAGREQTKGNIHKATVVRVEQGLQAAFVDYGAERLGFLQMGEIHPSYFSAAKSEGEGKGRLRINDVLRRGQDLLVQVVKEERGTKGAALTTFLSLPGRYMVLMPESDSRGVSRKIEDEAQRKKLKEIMGSLNLPANMGFIVRTAGIGQTKEELKRDFDYLVRLYENTLALSRQVKAPTLVYKESNLVIRSIRDYFTSDVDEVLVDDPRVFQEAREFFQQVMPEYARLVKLHQERRPIFSRYQIEEQIETISKNKIVLPSGGSIVIDVTEALVAVDVNSGKMAGETGVEATAYKTNLEAAEEAARQLRLRDLGGLIVLDFIDMRDRKHIREVEKALKEALKHDKARVTVGRISQFGLLEMSRQRIKAALAEGSFLSCPHCQGTGRIKSAEAQAVAFLRKVQAGVAKGQIGRVDGEVPLEVATYLLNVKREELLDMERRHQLTLFVKGRPDFVAGQSELTFQRREKEETAEPLETPLAISALAVVPPLPAPAAEPLPAEAPAEAGAEPAAAEEGKKKRKRRRKKKPGEELPAAAAEAGPEAAEIPAEAPAEEEPSLAEAEAVVTEPAPPKEEGKKKRKRRRKKKPGEELPAAAAESVPEAAELAAEAPDVAAPLEAATPAEAETPAPPKEEGKKKRKRHRRKKKPGEELPAAAAESLLEAAERPAEAPPVLPVPAEESFMVPVATEEPAVVSPEPAPPGEEGKKPKRRPRRKKPVEEMPEAAAAPAATVPPVELAAAPEEKPAPAEAEAPAAAPAEPPRTEPEEKKPKRQLRRKQAAKEMPEAAAAPAAAAQPQALPPITEAIPAPVEAAPPTPGRRPRAAKRPAKPAGEEVAAPAGEEISSGPASESPVLPSGAVEVTQPMAEPPAARPRKTARRKSAVEPAAPAAPGEVTAAAPLEPTAEPRERAEAAEAKKKKPARKPRSRKAAGENEVS